MTITTPVECVSAANSTLSNASQTKSHDACFQGSACQKAEVMWALKHVYNGLMGNSAKNVVGLLKTMFPGSKIAEEMQLELNKLKYVVNHGTAPYVKVILKNQVIDFVWFVV